MKASAGLGQNDVFFDLKLSERDLACGDPLKALEFDAWSDRFRES